MTHLRLGSNFDYLSKKIKLFVPTFLGIKNSMLVVKKEDENLIRVHLLILSQNTRQAMYIGTLSTTPAVGVSTTTIKDTMGEPVLYNNHYWNISPTVVIFPDSVVSKFYPTSLYNGTSKFNHTEMLEQRIKEKIK